MQASITLTGRVEELLSMMQLLADHKVEVKVEAPQQALKKVKTDPEPGSGDTQEDMPAEIVAVDREMVRAEALIKSREGKREEVKALLKEHNVKSITMLSDAQIPKFYHKIKDL